MKTLILAVFLVACTPSPSPAPPPARATLALANHTAQATVAFVSFGSDSVVRGWPACAPVPSGCSVPLPAQATVTLPLGDAYLNATIAFDAPPACSTTVAEVNLNNPAWYDVADVSLVNGWNRNVAVQFGAQRLGPPHGASGNERVLGVFPLGCDVCVARMAPPCGIAPSPVPGTAGCKAGSDPYHPAVPCQVQGTVKGGGTAVVVSLEP